MKTEGGIPILDRSGSSDISADELSCTIATNALRTMTESLVKMESAEAKPEDMMEKCVWPIIYEAARRFDTISKGDTEIPDGGFEYVVG